MNLSSFIEGGFDDKTETDIGLSAALDVETYSVLDYKDVTEPAEVNEHDLVKQVQTNSSLVSWEQLCRLYPKLVRDEKNPVHLWCDKVFEGRLIERGLLNCKTDSFVKFLLQTKHGYSVMPPRLEVNAMSNRVNSGKTLADILIEAKSASSETNV